MHSASKCIRRLNFILNQDDYARLSNYIHVYLNVIPHKCYILQNLKKNHGHQPQARLHVHTLTADSCTFFAKQIVPGLIRTIPAKNLYS